MSGGLVAYCISAVKVLHTGIRATPVDIRSQRLDMTDCMGPRDNISETMILHQLALFKIVS